MTGPTSASLRVTRSGPGDVVARVTLSRPDVHNAFDAALIGDLRTAFATLARESPDPASSGDPGRRWAVLLRRRRPRLDARRDVAGHGGQRAGRDGDGRHVRGHRHLPGAGRRPRPRRGAGWRDGAAGGLRRGHRRVRDALRLHRDAAGDPAIGHQPVRRRQDRRDPRPGAVPGRPAIRRHPRRPDRAGPRDRRRRGGARPSRRRGGRGPAGFRDRPRRERPRRSSARSAVWATDRPSGTRRGSSRDSGRARRPRRASEPSPRSGVPPGHPIRTMPDPDRRRKPGATWKVAGG